VSRDGKISGDAVLALRQVMKRDDRDDHDWDTNEDEQESQWRAPAHESAPSVPPSES
jgi:hypothetical protein